MTQFHGNAAQQAAELIENVGLLAARLLAACAEEVAEPELDPKDLLERALIVAAEAQQQLTEQRERIASLEALSFTDELTGLFNRRGFHEQLRRILAVSRRIESTGVLAFIDLDRFKAINDGLGHVAGDAVLRHVANLLNDNTRATDVVARLGGDEFAAALVHTSPGYGRRRAEALEQSLNSSVVHYEGYKIPVHASFGIKAFGPDTEAESLLARADAAMYRNKRGKPQVLHAWHRRS
jgi:diguanylate cyclase (GGDEF)-like protein